MDTTAGPSSTLFSKKECVTSHDNDEESTAVSTVVGQVQIVEHNNVALVKKRYEEKVAISLFVLAISTNILAIAAGALYDHRLDTYYYTEFSSSDPLQLFSTVLGAMSSTLWIVATPMIFWTGWVYVSNTGDANLSLPVRHKLMKCQISSTVIYVVTVAFTPLALAVTNWYMFGYIALVGLLLLGTAHFSLMLKYATMARFALNENNLKSLV